MNLRFECYHLWPSRSRNGRASSSRILINHFNCKRQFTARVAESLLSTFSVDNFVDEP